MAKKPLKFNKNEIADIFFNPETRVSRLKRLINSKKIVRFIESHNPITGLLVENLKINFKKEYREFDGIWSASLTDSVSNGKPDNQSLELSFLLADLLSNGDSL